MATPTIITQGAMSQDSSGVNKYNPNTGNLLLPGQSVQVKSLGNQPPTIPAGVGLGNVKATGLPNTTNGTAASGLSGASAGYMAMPALSSAKSMGSQLTSANNVANQNAQQGQQDYQSQVLGLINQMQNRPGELEQQYGIQQLSADALKAKANYDSVELGYRRQKEATMTDGAISADQKQARIGEIERKEASQKADIAIDYNLKAGLLSNAKELMQKQIALELEPMKLKVDYYKDNRDRFDKILDKTEMRQYDFIQKQEERAYQAAQKAADRISSLQMKAIENGVSWDKAKNIRSVDDYAKLIGGDSKTVEKVFGIEEKIKSIDGIISNKAGIRGSVGPTRLQRGGILTVVPRGKLNADIQQLISQTTLDNLINAKGKGATFGALSEGELKLLSASGSKLATWAITDKNGNITGFKASEKQVKDELAKIKSYAVRDYEITTGQPYTTENDPAGLGIDIIQYDPVGLGI